MDTSEETLTKHFAFMERLALLSEEMGEAQQVIGKIIRHGIESRHPNGGPTNRELLELELGDVLAVIKLLDAADHIQIGRVRDRIPTKLTKLHTFTHLQSYDLLEKAKKLVTL